MRGRDVARGGGALSAVRENNSGFAFLAMLCAALVVACLPPAARADDDLPGRVGRIADFAGQLYQSPEDRATEWVSIGLNYPVTSGDNLWVSGDGRAEVDYGGGQFRLAGDTNLHVSRLDENQIAVFVAQGRVILRVRMLDPGESARVDAPNTQIQLTRPGLYRIDVSPDRQTTVVTIREGEAQVAFPAGVQQALPGQTVAVNGADAAVVDVRNGVGQDGFDTWSASRDRHYERNRAQAYVSRQMVGYADLDDWGTWQTTPDYGPVWYPTAVADDWAPYRFGYWTTVGGWGYTWVDDAPWGYAPFHYGRWAFVGGRWGWCPGAFVPRPVWAPALVGWVGGPAWGVSAGLGAPVYGWVPLGWGEPYHPWWKRCSYNCWTRYNRPYAVNVAVRPTTPPPRYRNVEMPGAVTAVNGATLAGRVSVANNLVRVPTQQVSAAPVLASAPAVGSGPLHVPMVRAGTGGTPQPASTFYPVTRAGRGTVGASQSPRVVVPSTGETRSGTNQSANARSGSADTFTRAPAPARPTPPQAVAKPGTVTRAPTGEAAVNPAGSQSLSRQSPQGQSLAPGGRTATVPEGTINANPPTRSAPRVAPPQSSGVPVPPTMTQQPLATPAAPARSEARPAPRSAPPQSSGVPVPQSTSAQQLPAGASAARPVPQRQPPVERGVPVRAADVTGCATCNDGTDRGATRRTRRGSSSRGRPSRTRSSGGIRAGGRKARSPGTGDAEGQFRHGPAATAVGSFAHKKRGE